MCPGHFEIFTVHYSADAAPRYNSHKISKVAEPHRFYATFNQLRINFFCISATSAQANTGS
jgi:hypothetical protein